MLSAFTVMAATTALSLSGCGSSNQAASSDSNNTKPNIIASFYPLVFLTEQIGGDAVKVTNLTPSGEAHDVELSTKDLTTISKADAMVYLSGFQAAVDDAVKEAKPKKLLDVAEDVKLVKASEHESTADQEHTSDSDHDHEAQTNHNHEASGTEGEDAAHEHHDHGLYDPHFWLDPGRMVLAIEPVLKTLSEVAPDHKAEFEKNAKELRSKLEALDQKYATGLKTCQTPTIVVAHEAYGYLAEKYHFKQIGVKGIDPESTTAIKRLEEVAKVAQENKVSTLFSESALNDKDVKTLGETLKIHTKVLDPLEIQVDQKQDYLKVMETNLANLKEAMKCS